MSPEILNGSAQEWVGRLVTASWQGALAAAGVWLLCRSTQLCTRMRCWLWWAVGVRLVVGLLPLGAVPLAVLPPQNRISHISHIGPIRPISPPQETAYASAEPELPAVEAAPPPPTPLAP